MSFGLTNAPATFQRLRNRVISGLEGCEVYLDDVVVGFEGVNQTQMNQHSRTIKILAPASIR